MYLIDSSIWIEYFRPRGSQSAKTRVRQVLQSSEALLCGPILVEILRGAKNKKQFDLLNETLRSLPQLPINQEVFDRAALWGFHLDRKGKIASAVDLILAAACYEKAVLLHNDSDFEMIAAELPLTQERIH
jgi:predicted nucleic acid-binding protein